jgi:Glycine cleavage system H protein (lipoate-binding)
MPDFLEVTVDKFTFRVAADRYYTHEGLWAQAEGGRVRVGLSDFLQQRSGDVAFAEVKPVNTPVAAGDELAVIETIKVNVVLASPLTGKVLEINPAMTEAPRSSTRTPTAPAGWR